MVLKSVRLSFLVSIAPFLLHTIDAMSLLFKVMYDSDKPSQHVLQV